MLATLFALISALSCVSVMFAQSCGPSQLSANTSSPSYFTSPNYPSNYPPSITCQWTITAPSGYVVELSFVTFETEGYNSASCSSSSDILEIYNGRSSSSSQLRGKYCSKDLPANVYSSGTSLYLRFTSDSTVEEKGFKIKYRAVIPRPNSTICSPFNTDYQNNNIQVSGSSGYIESPLYGDKYPSSMQCTWVITVPEGKKVKLTFLDFVVGDGRRYCSYYDRIYDLVEIRDGRYSFSTSLKTLCGQSLPSPVYSRGRYMWIRFKSNSNNNNPRNTTGFKAKYMSETIIPVVPTPDWRSRSDSSSYPLSVVIGIVIGVCALLFLVCICVCIAYRKRTPGHVTVQAPAGTQTTTVQDTQNQPGATFQYPQQIQGGFIVLRSQPSQSSNPPHTSGYPQSYQQHPLPAGSYVVPATGGGTPAPGYPPQSSPSAPMMPYPQQPIPHDAPPPYPGLPEEYLSQAATGQPAPNNPNPPPQDVKG